MLRAQSINTESENSENSDHILASTLTLTSKALKQKIYIFAINMLWCRPDRPQQIITYSTKQSHAALLA